MGKRRKVLLAVGCAAAVISTTLLLTRPKEPTYQGRTLSQWLRTANTNRLHSYSPHKLEAVRRIGTNALPWLLQWISYEPSRVRLALFNLSRKLTPGLRKRAQALLTWEKQTQRADDARYGFYTLGPAARSAIPQLTRFALTATDPRKAENCAGVLRHLGPDALPALVAIITSTNLAINRAAEDIVLFRTNALPYVPRLVEALETNDDWTAYGSARALGYLQLSPASVVPALIRALQGTNAVRRAEAALVLGWFRDKATSAIPALERASTDTDTSVRQAATEALKRIISETRTNAPSS